MSAIPAAATAPAGTPEGLGDLQKRLLAGLIAVALLEGVVATVIPQQPSPSCRAKS